MPLPSVWHTEVSLFSLLCWNKLEQVTFKSLTVVITDSFCWSVHCGLLGYRYTLTDCVYSSYVTSHLGTIPSLPPYGVIRWERVNLNLTDGVHMLILNFPSWQWVQYLVSRPHFAHYFVGTGCLIEYLISLSYMPHKHEDLVRLKKTHLLLGHSNKIHSFWSWIIQIFHAGGRPFLLYYSLLIIGVLSAAVSQSPGRSTINFR